MGECEVVGEVYVLYVCYGVNDLCLFVVGVVLVGDCIGDVECLLCEYLCEMFIDVVVICMFVELVVWIGKVDEVWQLFECCLELVLGFYVV